jgi:hypothetical protein
MAHGERNDELYASTTHKVSPLLDLGNRIRVVKYS